MQKILKKLKKMSPPVKWLFGFIAFSVALSILTAPQKKPVNFEELSFETSSDSRIYFHNVRSYYYNIDRLSKAPMEIFKLKRRSAYRDSMSLNFDIIRAPAMDQAFIYTEVGSSFKQCDSLVVKFSKYPEIEPLKLLNAEGSFRLAAKVYSSILEEEEIFLCCGNDTLQKLYEDKSSELDAEIVLEDYFRLTRKN